MRVEEIGGGEVLGGELGAGTGLGQTGPNPGPIIVAGDVVAGPGGEAGEAVLVEGHAGDGVGAGVAGDDEGEDEEDEEEDDEHEHADQVEPQEALLLPVGPHEARQGHQEEGDADEDEGPPEPPDALVVGLRRQPDPRRDDGDRAHQSQEIQQRRYVVAHRHHKIYLLRVFLCVCVCEREIERERR